MPHLVGFAAAALLAYLLTPIVGKIARKMGKFDAPGERKVHEEPTPRLGGVAIFAAFILSFGIYSLFEKDYQAGRTMVNNVDTWGILIAAAMVFGIGVWDDLWGVTPIGKVVVELGAAVILFYGGTRIDGYYMPGHGWVDFGMWSMIVTVIWVVIMCNAMNLLDGLDGLAAGVGFISLVTIFLVTFGDRYTSPTLALLLAGALLGFLRHNFNPAKIFMGDSGSLLLGLCIAVFSIHSVSKSAVFVTTMTLPFLLALPILDTGLAIFRRYFKGAKTEEGARDSIAGLKAVFKADQDHIHHRLLRWGLSHRNTVLALYGFQVACALIGIFVFSSGGIIKKMFWE